MLVDEKLALDNNYWNTREKTILGLSRKRINI